jgi:hypothetical protein
MLGSVVGCGRPAEPQAVTPPDAVQILREMSATLAQANQLTFTATREMDAALLDASGVPESARIEVAVSRPNKLRATSTTSSDTRHFYADGQSISLLDERMLLYATVPMGGSIDDVLDRLDAAYGFVPPLADFVASDPYTRFQTQIDGSVYQAQETVNGVACHRVSLSGQVADAEIWVATTDHLPRRFIATFKDREGAPTMKVEFFDWNLAATLDDERFAFSPPEDGERIPMRQIDDVTPDGAPTDDAPRSPEGE